MDWVHSTISIWATIQTISHAKARPQGLEQRSCDATDSGFSILYLYIYIWTNPTISTFYRPDLISFTIQLFDLLRILLVLPQFLVGLHFLAISLEQKKFMPM